MYSQAIRAAFSFHILSQIAAYTYVHMITLQECNMITLRYIKWYQNTVTPLAAVHFDWLENNGNTFVNKYMWNCGSCLFIVIQILPHLRQTKLKWYFQIVRQVCWSIMISFLNFLLCTGWRFRRFGKTSNSHVYERKPDLHPVVGSNTCPVISKHPHITRSGNSGGEHNKKFVPEIVPQVWGAFFKGFNKLS